MFSHQRTRFWIICTTTVAGFLFGLASRAPAQFVFEGVRDNFPGDANPAVGIIDVVLNLGGGSFKGTATEERGNSFLRFIIKGVYTGSDTIHVSDKYAFVGEGTLRAGPFNGTLDVLPPPPPSSTHSSPSARGCLGR